MAFFKEFHGKTPQTAATAFLAETAVLIGDVTVGSDSSVWYGAVIRGDGAPIVVGAGTSIQDNVTLHCEPGRPMIIGNNVTVGHNAIVHCTSVGDHTLVGMGARLLDGAVIGSHCIIGAGAVVKENAVVPDGTMRVGVPAKAIREIPPEKQAEMEQPSHYIELAKEYLK